MGAGSATDPYYPTSLGGDGGLFSFGKNSGNSGTGGGGIGVNYETRSDDGPEDLHGHKQDFDWGWTGGGGIEYMLGCHWSIKTEYLRYELDKQRFIGIWPTSTTGPGPSFPYHFDGNTEGNIIRAGLNYKF